MIELWFSWARSNRKKAALLLILIVDSRTASFGVAAADGASSLLDGRAAPRRLLFVLAPSAALASPVAKVGADFEPDGSGRWQPAMEVTLSCNVQQ